MIILPSKGNSWLYDFSIKSQMLFSRAEFEMTATGKRKAGVIHLDPKNFDVQVEQLNDAGLYFVPIFRIKKSDGFSHSLEIEDKIYNDTVVYGAISTNLGWAKEFRNLYRLSNQEINPSLDHEKVGELLGYPPCCSELFNRKFKNKDPIFDIATGNLINIPKENAIHLRYFGFRVIPWIPCSYYCDESVAYAKRWIDLMYDLDSDTTKKLLEILSIPGEFSLVNGQVLWKSDLFIGMCDGDYYIDPKKIVIR